MIPLLLWFTICNFIIDFNSNFIPNLRFWSRSVTLCTKCRNFMDFHPKSAPTHTKSRKWTRLAAICLLEAFKTTRKNDEICENPWKSSKILDEYSTKIDEKSRFEHVQVTLCKKAWFSRPGRFWSRSGNALHKAPKFHGFSYENCSDAYKIQKMNAFRSALPPGSVQNDAQKWWNLWKSVKIDENPRCVPYKIDEKSGFEHAQVTLCKKAWFSRPERFW